MNSMLSSKTRMASKIVFGIISTGLFIAAIFYVAGKVDWLRGWLYVLLVTCGQSVSACYIWRKDPEVLIRRGEIGQNVKTWDKILLGIFGLFFVGIIALAALDARKGWSVMPMWLSAIGVLLYLVFVTAFTWAMAENPHFEKLVRIQEDRNHRVIDTGPYAIVRHPGYLVAIVGFIMPMPLLLGSWLAFAPASLAAALFVVRTVLEDHTLRKELPGYEEYAQRVRYRLLYGIW